MSETPQYFLVGRLVDGSGGPVAARMLLTVAHNRFIDIAPYDDSAPVDPNLLTDLSWAVVLPPLIDSHVHLCMSGSIDPDIRTTQVSVSDEKLREMIAEHVNHHFSHGVFAVRDGGDLSGGVLRYQAGHRLRRDTPLIKASGPGYHRPGGYGRRIGRSVDKGESLAAAYEKEKRPVDHVKLFNSGLNSLTQFGLETRPQFSLDELREVVRLAHGRGRKVMVHANGEAPVRLAVEAGCDSIEHGFFMGRDNLKRMAARGTFWVPTIATMKACGQHIDSCSIKADSQVVEKNLRHQLQQVAAARELGVKIAVGTDAGSFGVLHGESMVEELKLLMQAGYPLVEAIGCATEHGAQLLGLDDELGRIAVGKPAHFLVARGLPAQLPRKLLFLEAVYVHGTADTSYQRLRQGVAYRR